MAKKHGGKRERAGRKQGEHGVLSQVSGRVSAPVKQWLKYLAKQRKISMSQVLQEELHEAMTNHAKLFNTWEGPPWRTG